MPQQRRQCDVWFGHGQAVPADVDELFDLVVDSCEEGVRKPDPAIFRTALDRLGVADPARAIFLDDFEGNLVAARTLGMRVILVGPDPRPALDELAELLG